MILRAFGHASEIVAFDRKERGEEDAVTARVV
jgi:hypothetical protein